MTSRSFVALSGYLLVLLFAPSSWGGEYQITNITDNANPTWSAALNNLGQVAWEEGLDEPLSTGFGLNFEIFLFNGSTTRRISQNGWDDMSPKLNDNGQITWMGEPVFLFSGPNYEIFFYDGSDVRQMSFNVNHDTNPDINNAGQSIWEEHERYNAYGYIYFFDGATTHQLVSSTSYTQGANLNDFGQAIWQVRFSGYDKIYYFDGTNISPLTGGTNDQWQATINNSGQIAWAEDVGNDSEIFLSDNGVIKQITDNDYDDYRPILNELGQIAWTAYLNDTSSSAEVFFFDGLVTNQITNNDAMDWAEDLNINGHIAIDTRLVPTDYSGATDEVFVYDGEELVQVTSNGRNEHYININDLNQLAWIGYGSHTNQWGSPASDVFLANRIEPIDVFIDIKPGSDPNCFNNNGTGVIPVAILGSSDFDVLQVDAATVQLASLQVKAVGKSNKLLASYEDVNGDGFLDMVAKIEDEDGVFEIGEVDAILTGSLLLDFNSMPFKGSDAICVVP